MFEKNQKKQMNILKTEELKIIRGGKGTSSCTKVESNKSTTETWSDHLATGVAT